MVIDQLNPATAESVCRTITASLPDWFGIPEANERYAAGVQEKVCFGVAIDDKYVGMIAIEFPFPNNANIYWLGVDKASHRQGIGKALVTRTVEYCRQKGAQSLTVETLSPEENDPGYLMTYQFYRSLGFQPLFELNTYGPTFRMVYMYLQIDRA